MAYGGQPAYSKGHLLVANLYLWEVNLQLNLHGCDVYGYTHKCVQHDHVRPHET